MIRPSVRPNKCNAFILTAILILNCSTNSYYINVKNTQWRLLQTTVLGFISKYEGRLYITSSEGKVGSVVWHLIRGKKKIHLGRLELTTTNIQIYRGGWCNTCIISGRANVQPCIWEGGVFDHQGRGDNGTPRVTVTTGVYNQSGAIDISLPSHRSCLRGRDDPASQGHTAAFYNLVWGLIYCDHWLSYRNQPPVQ